MKKLFTLLLFASMAFGANAQLAEPITFEQGGIDTLWIPFANGTAGELKDILVVQNPLALGVNLSDSVLQFNVHDNSDPWVGMYSDNFGFMEFTNEAHTLTMMVLKTITSPVAVKLEQSINGGAINTTTHDNTLTDEWEMMTFDMTAAIGKIYGRLTIFPDFPATRTGGTIVYLDNIANAAPTAVKQLSGEALKLYPNPAEDIMYVQYPKMSSLTISDVLGKTIARYNFQLSNSKALDLSEMNSGMYFLTAKTANGIITSKFMKK